MALQIMQQIGNRYGEAAILHNLASIDLERGEYDKARQKLETSLKITQQVGDRVGEAETFAQLGIMASLRGCVEGDLRLVALSVTILKSIGNAKLKEVEPWINGLASKLSYTQEQFDAMIQEVAESYQRDRGWSLIEAAFADPAPDPDKV
jgi:hypothetical protein